MKSGVPKERQDLTPAARSEGVALARGFVKNANLAKPLKGYMAKLNASKIKTKLLRKKTTGSRAVQKHL